MTEFILKKLGYFDEVRHIDSFLSGKVNLDFSTATSTIFIVQHIFEKFGNCVVVWSCSNIKHQSEFWLDVFANTLEEPFMTVDFSVISLLHRKDEINSSSLQRFVVESKVPSANLKQMQDIFWNSLYILVINFVHRLHSQLLVSILSHESFLNQQVNIKKLFLCSILSERFWNLFKTITNAHNNHVRLS
jgi:hypothetical protein